MDNPFGMTLFCDDIRSEIGGKYTYVGVYGADLQVEGNGPITLPMLSCVIIIIIPFGFSYKTFNLIAKIKTDSGQDILSEISVPPIPPPSSKDRVARQQFNLTMSPFVVKGNSRLMVRAYFDELEVKLGALDIKVIPSNQPLQPQPS